MVNGATLFAWGCKYVFIQYLYRYPNIKCYGYYKVHGKVSERLYRAIGAQPSASVDTAAAATGKGGLLSSR